MGPLRNSSKETAPQNSRRPILESSFSCRCCECFAFFFAGQIGQEIRDPVGTIGGG